MKKEIVEPARYIVGIDLGTTNSAVAYFDTQSPNARIENLAIPQIVAPGLVENRGTLPSFLSLLENDPVRLPWDTADISRRAAVGVYARDIGVKSPATFVSSAKSWLCHAKMDRTAKFLPWNPTLDSATEPEPGKKRGPAFRWSPVEVSAQILAHIRNAWNSSFPDFPLETQDVVITLPASFDEIARELTIQAAHKAGLDDILLIEEPQAAFYCWMESRLGQWNQFVRPDQKILVCDIGGGTTDLTLIRVLRVKTSENDTETMVRFHRIAVGDHLILGGDNFDYALADHFEKRLIEEKHLPVDASGHLPPRQYASLVRLSCRIKEDFLTTGPEHGMAHERYHLPGLGSKLIGGSIVLEVTRQEVESVVLDGFFPKIALETSPIRRRSGLREMGLPFADDPAITRHLARFLTAHRHTGEALPTGFESSSTHSAQTESVFDPARPDCILFNGGVFRSEQIQNRLIEVISHWFPDEKDSWQPQVLVNAEPDLAVARGAAWYGRIRRDSGQRISASLARTYYVGIETISNDAVSPESDPVQSLGTKTQALCLVPASVEPGMDIPLSGRKFELTVGKPVRFPIYVSSVRLTDLPGEMLEINSEEMKALPPIQTVLKTRSAAKLATGSITAELKGHLTELGTVELFLSEIVPEGTKGRRGTWKLQFDVRGATQTGIDMEKQEGTGSRTVPTSGIAGTTGVGILDESLVEPMEALLIQVFGKEPGETPIKPSVLVRRLEEISDMSREAWPPTLLRRLVDILLKLDAGRQKSMGHETRWLNLLGFCCRPGFGVSMDDWRIDCLWKQVAGLLVHKTQESRTQNWILWRRIASGLSSGRQITLVEPLLSNVRDLYRQLIDGRGRGADLDMTTQEGAEIWRLLGAMELLPPEIKTELGGMIIELAEKKRLSPVRNAMLWALGRLGTRVLFHAPLDKIVPAFTAEVWAKRILQNHWDESTALFALSQLIRKTNEAILDVSDSVRQQVVRYLTGLNAPEMLIRSVLEYEEADHEETSLVFGESLPLGLKITES